MTCVHLDGREIFTRDGLHDALVRALPLPEWYGRNLDALMDCLTSLPGELSLHLSGVAALRERLGPYASAFLRVLRQAEEDNPRFHLLIEPSAPCQ